MRKCQKQGRIEKKKKRTLYECGRARVKGNRIYCSRSYCLSQKSQDGSLDIRRLAAGEPLVQTICQTCLDFDRLGPPLTDERRGWHNLTMLKAVKA